MNGTPRSSKFRLLGRDGQGGGGLSTGTIIVIAVVCGCVAILALTLFLWRLLVRCCRPRESAPLPPVQDLAHHRREQQRAAFHSASSRPTTWVGGSLRSAPSHTPYASSAVSLLTQEKNPSVYTDDMATAESALPSPDDESKLYPPNPSFYRAADGAPSRQTRADSASVSQSSLPSDAGALSPSDSRESRPLSPSSSHTSPAASPARPQSRQPSLSRPPSSHSRARRPLSQVSDSPTSRSGLTVRSASGLRGGAPHLSGAVQIVLPAPLGPQPPYALEGPLSMYSSQQPSRSSVFADQWIGVGGSPRNSTLDVDAETRTLHKSRSRSRHRQTASLAATPRQASTPSPSGARRAASQHESRSRSALRHQVPVRADGTMVPVHEDGVMMPVREDGTMMPAPYGTLADLAGAAYDDDAARGRSRTATRLQTIPAGRVS